MQHCTEDLRQWMLTDRIKLNDHKSEYLLILIYFEHVSGSTRRRGHTLDLIITRKDESLIKEVEILHNTYSDHLVVTCKLNFAKPPRSKNSRNLPEQ